MTEKEKDENKLYRSAMMGSSYLTSEPVTFQDIVANVKYLGHSIRSLFGRGSNETEPPAAPPLRKDPDAPQP